MHEIPPSAAVPGKRSGVYVVPEIATTFGEWAEDRGYDKATRTYARTGASS